MSKSYLTNPKSYSDIPITTLYLHECAFLTYLDRVQKQNIDDIRMKSKVLKEFFQFILNRKKNGNK